MIGEDEGREDSSVWEAGHELRGAAAGDRRCGVTRRKVDTMSAFPESPSLDGWDMADASQVPWVPWGEGGKARAKILAQADGYTVALIEAESGYRGNPHEHAHAEFSYLLEGVIKNQGRVMESGDAYAASAGSVHSDFEVQAPATYLTIFRL